MQSLWLEGRVLVTRCEVNNRDFWESNPGSLYESSGNRPKKDCPAPF